MAGTPVTIPVEQVIASVNEMVQSGENSIAAYRQAASYAEQMAMGSGLQTQAGQAIMVKVNELKAIINTMVADQNEKSTSMSTFNRASVDLQDSKSSIVNSLVS